MVTYGVLTARARSVVLLNVTDLIANFRGTVSLPIVFEDLFFCGLMISLFIVYLIHIYVNLYFVHTYILWVGRGAAYDLV